MGQLSFFSADLQPPLVDDLGGLLAASGQITESADGARLSLLTDDPARASALVAECAARHVAASAEPDPGDRHQLLVRTDRSAALVPLARRWTRGAVKRVPDEVTVSAGFVRLWVLAAGHVDDVGYLLGVDPHRPENVEPLIAACARAGLAGCSIGPRGGGPAVRIVGHKRLARLVDTVGTLPPGLPADLYPVEPILAHTARY